MATVSITSFSGVTNGKVPGCQYRRQPVQSLGQEDPLEEKMATHFSTLAWRIPLTEGLVSYSPWSYKDWTWLKWLRTCAPYNKVPLTGWFKQQLFISHGSDWGIRAEHASMFGFKWRSSSWLAVAPFLLHILHEEQETFLLLPINTLIPSQGPRPHDLI